MIAMAAKGKRDQRPPKSINTPQISAMIAKRDARVSVTIDEPLGAWLEAAQLAILLGKALPLIGDGALMEDRVDRALGLAGATLDALVRVYVVHVWRLVNSR